MIAFWNLQFHWQFHPAAHKWHEILDSKKYGKIVRTDAVMTSGPSIPAPDIRWKFDLAGGSAMGEFLFSLYV